MIGSKSDLFDALAVLVVLLALAVTLWGLFSILAPILLRADTGVPR